MGSVKFYPEIRTWEKRR